MSELTTIQQLDDLLRAERAALLDGDFDKIAELLDLKESLTQDLNQEAITPADLAPLRDGMHRNQELFDHALAGIRNVAARLGDLNRIRKSMDTYDAYGRRTTIDAPKKNKLERRA